MSEENNTIERVVTGLVQALKNVLTEIGNPATESVKTLYFLRRLGWNIPLDTDFSGKSLSFVHNLSAIKEDDSVDVIELIALVKNIISDFDKIKDELALGSQFADFKNEFPKQLLDYAVLSYLESEQPKIKSVFLFLGIADTSYITTSSATRIPYKQFRIDWDKLLLFLRNPAQFPKIVYGWGTSDYKSNLLIEHIEYLLTSFDIVVGKYDATSEIGSRFELSGDAIYAPFFDSENIKAGIEFYPLKTDSVTNNEGLAIAPFFFGTNDKEVVINDFFKFINSSQLKIDKTLGIEIRPQTGFSIYDINTTSAINGEMKFTLKIGDEDGLIIIGDKDSTRLEIRAVDVNPFSKSDAQAQEFGMETGLKDSKLVLDFSQSDGFISSLVPIEPLESPLDLSIGYSNRGIYFKGSAGIEIKLPIHVSLGPLEISAITIALKIENRKIPISTTANFKAELGPLTVVVEDIGASLTLNFPENGGGNMGPFDLSFGFKPPKGLGLSVNAGAVTGGGYLYFDFEKEEYAGVLELTIAGFISVKAIGLINTKMPDGSKGFSLLMIITAEFNPPFQLGFGFTLMGVGGIVGLNRTVLLDPLREGVRTGAVSNILFPTDVIANASRIISDIRTIFPVYEGKFLIGPMAKIGWGTPALISLQFGLIIEIPGNIAILGVLKIILPDEKVPIVKIQVAFVGTIDFDKKMLTFDASLFESSILQTMTLEGDMALRLAWGDNANFLITIGGFHPSFVPPPLALPTLKRLSINILNTEVSKIRVEFYQAVTSNTVQFGAKAEVAFDLKACSIDGFISFDALFQFDPFYFIIEIRAGFNLEAAGIDLMSVNVRMSLEGPTPWRARGTGKVSLLFISISADFDKTWGENKTTTLPKITVLPQFLEQLQKKEQWNTVLSTSKNLGVSLRKLDEATENLLVLHPAGSLVLQQKLLPLKVNIDRIGNQKTEDIKNLIIESVYSNDTALTIKEVNENFARAQYQNLSNDEKLSKPSFEKMQGGVEISMGANTIQNGKMVRKKIEYELTIVDKEPVKLVRLGKYFKEIGSMFRHFVKGNSISKSKLSKSYLEKLQPFEQKIELHEELFIVAFQKNNTAFSTASTFKSEMEAQSFMQQQVRVNPNLKQKIHIVPQFELQES